MATLTNEDAVSYSNRVQGMMADLRGQICLARTKLVTAARDGSVTEIESQMEQLRCAFAEEKAFAEVLECVLSRLENAHELSCQVDLNSCEFYKPEAAAE